MKTLFLTLIFLIISNITYSQFRIGTVRMADSTGTLTVSAPIKSWQSHWVKMKDLDSTIAGPGLKYTGSGLTLKIGPGLYISNDTLFVEGLSNKFFDEIRIIADLETPTINFLNVLNEDDTNYHSLGADIKINNSLIIKLLAGAHPATIFYGGVGIGDDISLQEHEDYPNRLAIDAERVDILGDTLTIGGQDLVARNDGKFEVANTLVTFGNFESGRDIYFEGYLNVGNSLTSETVIKYDRSLFPKLVVDNVEPDDLEYGQVILWYDTEHLYWLINVDGKNWKVQLQ